MIDERFVDLKPAVPDTTGNSNGGKSGSSPATVGNLESYEEDASDAAPRQLLDPRHMGWPLAPSAPCPTAPGITGLHELLPGLDPASLGYTGLNHNYNYAALNGMLPFDPTYQ